MNLTLTQLASRARTWLLVAGLSALLITAGALLGGAFLWMFVLVAVAGNLAGYWYSDRIALRATRAEPLQPGQAPELEAMVAELAGRAGVPAPRLFLMPGAQANAFATGRNPQHAAIAVTEGLLRTLPADQVRGVLAHEMAHIANHDILVSSVAAMIAAAVSAVGTMLQLSFLFGTSEEDAENPLAALAMMLIAPFAATLLQLAVSRQREFLADSTAARLMGTGRPLADALASLSDATREPLAVNAAMAPMYIVNPLNGTGLAGLFSTHPPLSRRIERLAGLEPLLRGRAGTERGLGSPRASALRHRRHPRAEGVS